MKKNLFSLMLGVVATLASCSQSESDLTLSQGEAQATTFTIQTQGPAARASVTDLSRYIVEAYEGGDFNADPLRVEAAVGSLTLSLKQNTEYAFLFWADYGSAQAGEQASSGYWNTDDLQAVSVSESEKGKPGVVAYSSSISFNSANFAANATVVLRNATAQVLFVETEGLLAADNSLAVTYATAQTLNLATGIVTNTAEEVTHNFTGIAQADKDEVIATDYVLAPLSDKNLVNLKVALNGQSAITVNNVPFQQNYRTHIQGAYSSFYNAEFTVTTDDNWNNPDYNVGGEEQPEQPEEPTDNESLIVEIAGIKWAVGNLVADGANGCKIGAPTDGGLYFRWGALIGWSGAVNDDGTGVVVAGSNNPHLAVVLPTEFTGTPAWGDATNTPSNPYVNGVYTASDFATKNLLIEGNGTVTANQVYNPALAIGDACRYYLGAKFRMPTAVEYNALFDMDPNFGKVNIWLDTDLTAKVTAFGWSKAFDEDPKGLSFSSEGKTLFIPASGLRNRDNGAMAAMATAGYGWSASPYLGSGTTVYSSIGTLWSKADSHRAGASPIRCVYESAE